MVRRGDVIVSCQLFCVFNPVNISPYSRVYASLDERVCPLCLCLLQCLEHEAFDENGQTTKPEKWIFWSIVTVATYWKWWRRTNNVAKLIFPGEVKVTRKMEIWDAILDKLTKNVGNKIKSWQGVKCA